MNTHNSDYTPVPNSLALTVAKEHRIMVIRKATKAFISITWKTLLYAFILTIANVII